MFDFDVLMDENFQHIWPLLNLAADQLPALQGERNTIKGYLDAKGREVCKAQGLSAFEGTELAEVTTFVGKMMNYGLCFVPVGELECWLAALGIERTRNKPKWLTDVFTRMGADPNVPGYTKAGDDDVWTFIDSVEAWIARPDRLGIPD